MPPERSTVLFGHRTYWLCQGIGWFGLATLGILDQATFYDWDANAPSIFFGIAGAGVGVTHLYRGAILKARGWDRMSSVRALLPRAAAGSLLLAAAMLLVVVGVDYAFPDMSSQWAAKRGTPWAWAVISLDLFLVAAGWNAIYFVHHVNATLVRQRHAGELHRWHLQVALVESELTALRAQVHPHFLFNSLNGVRNLVLTDPQRARSALTQLAGILRYALQSGAVASVPLEEELRVVDDYLALEALRFEDRLRVRRSVDAEALRCPVPPFSVQTLVDNAVKHGVSPFDEPLEITLHIGLKPGGTLLVEVGNGGSLAAAREPSTGIGLANLRQRVRLLFGESAGVTLRQVDPERVLAVMQLPPALSDHRPPSPAVPDGVLV